MNLRDNRAWTMNQLADEAGLHKNVLYRMAHLDPSLETLRGLGGAFNVPYWELLIPGRFTYDRDFTPLASEADLSREQAELQGHASAG